MSALFLCCPKNRTIPRKPIDVARRPFLVNVCVTTFHTCVWSADISIHSMSLHLSASHSTISNRLTALTPLHHNVCQTQSTIRALNCLRECVGRWVLLQVVLAYWAREVICLPCVSSCFRDICNNKSDKNSKKEHMGMVSK